jgi:small neutral amino acid transporter SnatA (MarC family)
VTYDRSIAGAFSLRKTESLIMIGIIGKEFFLIDLVAVKTIATTFFIISNPIGNSPAILALIKDYPIKRQKFILFRECVLSLLLALFFQYFGEVFLDALMLKDYTIAICGGVLLLLIGLNLIFPDHSRYSSKVKKAEPFFVPIATPLLTGPSLLTIVMLYSRQIPSDLTVSVGLVTAWIGVGLVLLITPYLQKLLGNKGITALEQLMGMILSMISIEMLVNGLHIFLQNTN